MNVVKTILGPVAVREEIDAGTIMAFRSGGCAALARRMYKILRSFDVDCSVVITVPHDCEYEDLDWVIETCEWGHALVLVDGFMLDIGGWEDYPVNNFLDLGVREDHDTLVDQTVEDCPKQDPLVVDFYAFMALRTYMPEIFDHAE